VIKVSFQLLTLNIHFPVFAKHIFHSFHVSFELSF
jgi:hypothetical protein